MAPLDVCRRARPQGLIAAPGSRGAGAGGRRRPEPQHKAKRSGPPCTHTFRFLARTRTSASSAPAAPEVRVRIVFEMQLFQGCLSRGRGRGASHELRPWLLPLKKAGAGFSAGAESGGDQWLPRLLQHHCRPRRGSGERLGSLPDIRPAASPSERCSCALRRLSPPPAQRRRRAPPRRALRAAPSPWKFPRRPGTAIQPRAPPPRQPGPSLPAPPREEKNSLSSVNSAARRSLPLRLGLRRQTPGDWWKSRSPPSPTRQIAVSDPLRSATRGWSARPSPALALWR